MAENACRVALSELIAKKAWKTPEDRAVHLNAITKSVAATDGIVDKPDELIPWLRRIPGLATMQDKLLRSKLPGVRALTQRLITDDASTKLAKGAKTSEIAQTAKAAILVDAMREFDPALRKWARATGKRVNEETASEFATTIGIAIRSTTPHPDPNVMKVVEAARAGLRKAVAMGKKAGTFDDSLQESDTYLSRLWNGAAMRKARDEHGMDKLRNLFARAVTRGFADVGVTLEAKKAVSIADGFLKRILDRADGVDMDTMHGLSLQNLDKLRELLEESGLGRIEIEDIADQLKNVDVAKASKVGAAKHRMLLDETAEWDGLRMVDLLENDIRLLLPKYANRVGADIAFRQTLGVPATNAGIARLVDDARLLGANEDEAHYLEAIMLDLAGMPQASMRNPEGWWPRVSAAGRNLAYITFGGMFGLASMAESSVIVAKQGLLGTFGVIPDLAKVRRSALDGRLSNEFLDYQLGYTGLGADSFIRPAGVKGTRYEADTGQFVYAKTKVERALEKGRNFVARASGLQGITEWQRRQMPIHILAEFESVLMRGKALTGGVQKRFAAMGYDEAGLKELKAAMDRFGVDITNHGRTIRRADMERWAIEDPKTHARFQRAIMRETEKAIIDVSVGKQPPWLNTEAGKIFGQFLGFTLHSYNTHLMRGFNLHDWQTAVNAMTSMFIAANVGIAINYARHHDNPAELEERLSLMGMAKWGFARSTFGGIPSMAVDNLLAIGGWDGFFNSRYSSLDSKAISLDSTPTISLANRFWEIGQRAVQVGIGQKAVSGSDAKAVVRGTPLTVFPSIQRGTQRLFSEVLGVPFEDLR